MNILVETSARHIHLSRKDKDILFGKNYELSAKKELSQPGQFVCNEKVEIVGKVGSIKNVSVLGPLRSETQVEISLTDSRKLGITTQIRESGNISGTAGCKIIGPNGEITINEGVIIAKRHIHMTPKDAMHFNVKDGENVWVKVQTKNRSVIFGDTVIRVSDMYSLAMHIDTDESNAAGISEMVFGNIV